MMENDFNCIDVETANSSWSSICQIGLVVVRSGKIADTWQSLVNPNVEFLGFNVSIHGITADRVRESPELPDIWDALRELTRDRPLVYHSPAWFDRHALTQAAEEQGLPQLNVEWVDSSRIVRHTWPERYGRRGFGLSNLSRDFKIEFQHHDALEDARAAALITLEALAVSGTSIREWAQGLPSPRARTRTRPERASTVLGKKAEGSSANDQHVGQRVVFTGRLSVPRAEAATIAVRAGCEVHASVRATTTILVVGGHTGPNLNQMEGRSKSSKQLQAERRIAAGQQIEILAESEFWDLLCPNP